MKKIVVVNASPRLNYNIATLLKNASDGAESKGATIERFIGPTKTLISGNTLQLNDYSKLDWAWTLFDIEAKKKRHEEVFPKECETAFKLGAEMFVSSMSL